MIYKRIQLLSLDVVLGALGCGVMAADLLEVVLPVFWWICFPVAVWVLYTADHLLDAIRLGENATTERHLYHVRHFRLIGTIWTILACSCLFVFPLLVPTAYLWLAVAAGGVSALHFGLVWLIRDRVTPWLAKEFGVALVYTTGVWGGSLALLPELPGLYSLGMLIQFLLLALINLLTFGVYEELSDEQNGFTSWARGLGKATSHKILLTMTGLILLSGGWILLATSVSLNIWLIQGTYLVMLSLLMWVARDPERFSPNQLYRAVADGAFLIPVLWIPNYLTTVYGF